MIKQTKKYKLCEYEKNKLVQRLTAGELFMTIISFWMFPLIALFLFIRGLFKESFYIEEEDYYKRKLKEVRGI